MACQITEAKINMDINRLHVLFEFLQCKYFESGEMFDSKYTGQYHVAAYILCLVNYKENDYPKRVEQLKTCLKFISNEFQTKEGRVSADFSLESICLAHYYANDGLIKNTLCDFLLDHAGILEEKITAQATDYYLLRYFNTLYYQRVLKVEAVIRPEVNERLSRLLKSSGVLFDSYDQDKGYPDLAYHCRNLQIMGACYSLLSSLNLEPMLIKALEFTHKFASKSGRLCFYGRTSDLIYGDASLVMAVSLFLNKSSVADWLKFFERFQEIYLNENLSEIYLGPHRGKTFQRLGYDSYVYPMVYELFSLSRLYCAFSDKNPSGKIKLPVLQRQDTSQARYDFDLESGFFKINSPNYELVLNIYGHQSAPIRRRDNRYMPLFPCHYASGAFSIPTPAFSAAVKYPRETLMNKFQRKITTKKLEKYYSKLAVGFLPIFFNNSKTYMIAECQLVKHDHTGLCITANKVYQYEKRSNQKLIATNEMFPCTINLLSESKLTLKFTYNRDFQAQYQISHLIGSKVEIKHNQVSINSVPILAFSVPVKLSNEKASSLESASGEIIVSILDIPRTDGEFCVTYL